jgi:hypothetical protein
MTYQIRFDSLLIATGDTTGECVSQLNNYDKSPQVVIERNGDSDRAYLRCTYLMNKNILLGEYTPNYGHRRIFNDVAEKVCAKMGYKLERLSQR